MMYLLTNKNWIFSIFSAVVLTAGLGYFYSNNLSKNQSEMVELTDLSDADIDLIVEVKSAMYAASIESY
jgi:sugar phosphate permease